MTDKIKLARNTILQTIAKIISIVLGWFIVVTMTNYLGAEGFGSYTIMVTYLQFFAVAADLGMVLVASQLLAENEFGNREKMFANLFSFRLVTAFGLLLLAPIFIWLLPYTEVVKNGVVILTLSFFLIALLQIFTGLFQAVLKMGRAMAAELLGRVVLLSILVIAAWLNLGLIFIVWGVVLGSAANVLLAYLLSRNIVKLRFAYDKEVWQTIWYRSWPIALGIIFNLIYLKSDTLILTFVRGEIEVGVYGAMYRMLEVLITFPTMFASLLLPLLAGYWARHEQDKFNELVNQSFNAMWYMVLPLIVGVWFTAPKIVALLGQDFIELGVPLLRWLSLAVAAIFIGTLLGHIIVAIGKQRSVLGVYASAAAIGLFGYLWSVPIYGAYGAAVMTVIVEVFVMCALLVFVIKNTHINFSVKNLMVALVALIPMTAFLFVSSGLSLWLIILVSVFIYFVTLYLLGGVSKNFVSQILKIS